jgi:hypothetical protein
MPLAQAMISTRMLGTITRLESTRTKSTRR